MTRANLTDMTSPTDDTSLPGRLFIFGKYWFASASLANPYCQSTWMSVCVYVCMYVQGGAKKSNPLPYFANF